MVGKFIIKVKKKSEISDFSSLKQKKSAVKICILLKNTHQTGSKDKIRTKNQSQ